MAVFEVEVHGTYEVKADNPEDARQTILDRITIDEDDCADGCAVSVNTLEVRVISAEE